MTHDRQDRPHVASYLLICAAQDSSGLRHAPEASCAVGAPDVQRALLPPTGVADLCRCCRSAAAKMAGSETGPGRSQLGGCVRREVRPPWPSLKVGPVPTSGQISNSCTTQCAAADLRFLHCSVTGGFGGTLHAEPALAGAGGGLGLAEVAPLRAAQRVQSGASVAETRVRRTAKRGMVTPLLA